MRADLGWSYLTAGMMNTVNAAGYLVGALLTPLWLRRGDARTVFLAGCAATAASLLAHGLVTGDGALYLVRFVAGVSNALVFVAGGLLAARLATAAPAATRGRAAAASCSACTTAARGSASSPRRWSCHRRSAAPSPTPGKAPGSAFAALAFVATGLAALATSALRAAPGAAGRAERAARRVRLAAVRGGAARLSAVRPGLHRLHDLRHLAASRRAGREGTATAFFALLGLAVMASPWIWAGVLQRFRGGGALALLCALVAVATLAPVLSAQLADRVRLGPAVRRRPSRGRRLDDRARSPQSRAVRLGRRHRRVHHRFRGRPDRRPEPGRPDHRSLRRLARRLRGCRRRCSRSAHSSRRDKGRSPAPEALNRRSETEELAQARLLVGQRGTKLGLARRAVGIAELELQAAGRDEALPQPTTRSCQSSGRA